MIDPLEQLSTDRGRARELHDTWSDLCALASVDHTGQAQVRLLVLRDLGERIGIFLNSTSPKWSELRDADQVQLLVYLASISVQYRLDASLQPIPMSVVNESWQLRPEIPKIMDWLYTDFQAQSSVIDNRQSLEARFAECKNERIGCNAPDTARGLYLNLSRIERLELVRDAIHIRSAWHLDSGRWVCQTLIP